MFKELVSTALEVAQQDKVPEVEEYTLSSQFIHAFREERPDLYMTFAEMFPLYVKKKEGFFTVLQWVYN